MNCSTPGFPVLNHLPEFAQTYLHESVMPFIHLILLSPSLCALHLSQHQGLFQWVGSSYQVAKVLELQLQHLNTSSEDLGLISFRIDLILSPCCPRDSQQSSPAPQLESTNFSALNLLYGPTLTSVHDYWKNHSFKYVDLCQQSNVSDV